MAFKCPVRYSLIPLSESLLCPCCLPFPAPILALTFLQVEIEVPQPCKFIMKTRDCSLSEMSSTRPDRKPVFVKSSSSEDFFFAMNRLAVNIPHIMWNTGFNPSQNDLFDRCINPVWNIIIFRICWLCSSLSRGFHLVAKGVNFALQPHISIGMLNRNLRDTASFKVCLCLYLYMCCVCVCPCPLCLMPKWNEMIILRLFWWEIQLLWVV